MRGVTARRRVAQFDWHYSFESDRLAPTPVIPHVFEHIRNRAASLAGVRIGRFFGNSRNGISARRFQKGKGNDHVTAAMELPARSIYLLTALLAKIGRTPFRPWVNYDIPLRLEL